VQQKTPWWRKPLVWAGGVGTVVVAGVVTTVLASVLTPTVQKLAGSDGTLPAVASTTAIPAITSHNETTNPASLEKATPGSKPTTSPLIIASEDPLNLDDMGVWAFPQILHFSSSQLIRANALLHQWPLYGLANYFYSLGGYGMNEDTQLVLQNTSNQSVSILDLQVVKDCGPPLSGTLFIAPGQASDDDVRLGFNLDSDDTDAESAAGWDTSNWKPDYFESKFISFSPGEQRVLNIRAATSKHSCTFTYQATVLEGRTKFYQTINDDGQPFRVTAIEETASKAPFSYYSALYAGGVYTQSNNEHGEFVKENPETYPG